MSDCKTCGYDQRLVQEHNLYCTTVRCDLWRWGRRAAMLTDKEKALLDKLGEAWDLFCGLPDHSVRDGAHADDPEDFCFLIHRLQDMVVARSGYREMRSGEDK